jgi:RNA polymerase sigma-70 factor (ECF subfamily)
MDQPLTEALAADLDGAFEELVRGHQDRLYSLALRYTGNAADAEELTQDAFVRAYRALERYGRERVRALDVRGWLTTILLNLCRNHAAKVGRRPREAEAPPELTAEPRHSPEAAAERRDAAEQWARLVLELPPVYRAAVLLRHVDGMSYAEMASVLDRPEGTVKAQVSRGTTLLRTAFEADRRRHGDPGSEPSTDSPQRPRDRVRIRSLEAVS